MLSTFGRAALGGATLVLMLTAMVATAQRAPDADAAIDELVEQGEYARAETLLRQRIDDPAAPVTTAAATRLEVLRRTRREFSLSEQEVLAQLRESLPEVTLEEVRGWTALGDLQHRVIDGETRYFRRGASNLFRLNDEARARRDAPANAEGKPAKDKYDLVGLIHEVLDAADETREALVEPVRHRVTFTLTVNEDCPRLEPGATVRAWLPFPQEYRQQTGVRLIASEPKPRSIAPNGAPHRTVYYEQTLGDDARPPRFRLEYEFVTSAYCPKLSAEAVLPYQVNRELYRNFTAERPPHIAITPEVERLAGEIVGDATNPLEKARRVFRWVSRNLPWIGEMEYCVIPSLSAKGLSARCGDCGVQGTVFITLCRAAGVPARWQSGFGTKPGEENMHDWAEFYLEPWGWLPADASYGLQDDPDPRVRDFFCGHMDPYRLIVNLDFARPLDPPKTSFRSEPNDFQRGEIEIDGYNLYFDDWKYDFEVVTERAE